MSNWISSLPIASTTPKITDPIAISQAGVDVQSTVGAVTSLEYSNVTTFHQANDTDWTAAFNRAIAAINAGSTSSALFIPDGSYTISGAITPLTRGATICGSSPSRAVITQMNSSTDTFTANTIEVVTFRDFKLSYGNTSQASTACAIVITCAASDATQTNGDSRVIDCEINSFSTGIYLNRASTCSIERCTINDSNFCGVRNENLSDGDAGDNSILNSTMNSTRPNTAAVLITSGGGLKISNSKILGHTWGILLRLANNIFTSDLLIESCSIEGQSAQYVRIQRSGTSGTFSNVVLAGNQLAGAPQALVVDADSNNPTWLDTVSWSGGTCATKGNVPVNVLAGNRFRIGGVVFVNDDTSADTCISFSSSLPTNADVTGNTYSGFGYPSIIGATDTVCNDYVPVIPASSKAAGLIGMHTSSPSFVYECVSQNNWVRTAAGAF